MDGIFDKLTFSVRRYEKLEARLMKVVPNLATLAAHSYDQANARPFGSSPGRLRSRSGRESKPSHVPAKWGYEVQTIGSRHRPLH